MATTTVQDVAVKLKLNNGVTPAGTVKTVSVSLGKMSIEGFDPTKVDNITALIAPCLAKSIYETVKVETSNIHN